MPHLLPAQKISLDYSASFLAPSNRVIIPPLLRWIHSDTGFRSVIQVKVSPNHTDVTY